MSVSYGFIIVVMAALTGCVSGNAIRESPLRVGYGVQVDPGWQLGNSRSSAHLLLAYSRIGFKGGGGHNNIYQVGGQLRHALQSTAPEGWWIGAELTYVNIRSKVSGSSVKQYAPGFTAGGLLGYRFLAGKIPMSFYVAPAYLSRGKFHVDGNTYGTTASGFYGRVGLDIHLLSLIHRQGR